MIFTDQLHRKIELSSVPKRIISLVPSQTELLYDLGLRDEVVGITRFCIHPEEWFRSKTRIGGTKKCDFEKIAALEPDLIIGNKEENEEVQIGELMQKYKVWMSDIYTLKDALGMIVSLGALLGKNQEATHIKLSIESRFHQFQQTRSFPSPALPKAAYFIWKDPYMVAGQNTFINEMMKACGLSNVFEENRYPEVSDEDIRQANPGIILLSSEPYPFKDKHIEQFRVICPDAKILVVDGEMFSWYGSRLLMAPGYFRQLMEQLIV